MLSILSQKTIRDFSMKPLAFILLCLFAVTSVTGCGGAGEPVTEEAAAESSDVDSQLESSGVSPEDYQKAMEEQQQQQGQ